MKKDSFQEQRKNIGEIKVCVTYVGYEMVSIYFGSDCAPTTQIQSDDQVQSWLIWKFRNFPTWVLKTEKRKEKKEVTNEE